MDGLYFLSQTELNTDEKRLITEECKKYLEQLKNQEEKGILSNLLTSFLSDDWSFLTQQEKDYLKTAEPEKMADYLIFRWKFRNYAKMKKTPRFPLYLLIEPTSICNLRCSICFQTDKTFSGNPEFMGKMDIELFKKVIDQAVEGGTKAVTLASRGEPSLHPQFGEMLKYCTDKFYDLKINTNATMLTEELMHDILKSKVSLVVFSVDAYDKEGYKRIRCSEKFDIVLANIKKMNEIKRTHYPNSTTCLRVHGVKAEKDFDGEKFLCFWKEWADEVTLSDCVVRWDTYNNSKIDKTEPCAVAFDRMYVWHDGTCNPCDVDYKSYLAVGNANNQTLAEIWNGEKYNQLRKAHFNGRRLDINPCDRCDL